MDKDTVRLIPLGGVREVGKNMLAIECGQEIIIIDCGVKFPDEDLMGIDLVIPDITYLKQNKERVKAVIITHGHEDHIGGIPFFLREINVPIYGTKLTLGLISCRLEEHGLAKQADLRLINSESILDLGVFKVEFFHVNHSIPDGVGVAIRTPQGLIVHSGDFKLDQTPIDGHVIDFAKLASYGEEGVLLFICDSTNVERLEFTPSEKKVGETFNHVFGKAKKRIIVATFASNVHRIQQIVDSAVKYGRKIAVVGRSMLNVVAVSMELGYLSMPPGTLIEIDEISDLPPEKTLIITTGSQGEPMAALTRMAARNHRQITIEPGDTVVISATPIPGNQKLVSRTINNLFKLGANVVYKDLAMVHVSGHAGQEEIKLMINFLKPKFTMPFHGEYRHLVTFAKLAQNMGMSKESVLITAIGDRVTCKDQQVFLDGRVPSGSVYVDGLGVGDVGQVVLRDRQHLSKDGIVIVVLTVDKQKQCIVAGPDLVSRGFIYMREAEELLVEAKAKVDFALSKVQGEKFTEWAYVKSLVRDSLSGFLFEKTKRRPVILPVIMEI